MRLGLPIEVLWIAESPPAGGGYFYFERTSARNHLFRETMKALGWWPLDAPMRAGLDKSLYLGRFQEDGNFLIDLAPEPVNRLSDAKREAALRKNVPRMMAQVNTLRPKNVLIIKQNVFEILYPAMQSSGFTVLNKEPIPFPSHGWQAEYRSKIQELVRLQVDQRERTPNHNVVTPAQD